MQCRADRRARGGCAVNAPRFGLRFWRGNHEVRLWQLSGGGRVRLRDTTTGREWWARQTDVTWEVCPSEDGHTFDTAETAASVAENITKWVRGLERRNS